jgi:hypothetical protein
MMIITLESKTDEVIRFKIGDSIPDQMRLIFWLKKQDWYDDNSIKIEWFCNRLDGHSFVSFDKTKFNDAMLFRLMC